MTPAVDTRARNSLVEQHLPLVRKLARRYAGGRVPYDDLVQVGAIGLIKAVDRFDATRGVELSTYAVPTILGEMAHFVRDSAGERPADPDEGAEQLDEEGERAFVSGEDRALIAAAARRLGERERRILGLRFYGDLSQTEIAERVHLSQIHVSRLLRASLEQMRTELGAQGATNGGAP